MRLKKNKTTMPADTATGTEAPHFKVEKSRPKIDQQSLDPSTPSLALSTAELKAKKEELQKQWDSENPKMVHVMELLRATRKARIGEMKKLEGGGISPILEDYPCFEEGKYVSVLQLHICILVPVTYNFHNQWCNFCTIKWGQIFKLVFYLLFSLKIYFILTKIWTNKHKA